ncbi:MAG: amidase, partial [Patescibacteria group bacterium]
MELHQLTIQAAAAGLRRKEFSAVELTRACLERINRTDKQLHAFLEITEATALAQAAAADVRFRTSEETSPLNGIPLAGKDIIATTEGHTTAASKILEHYQSPYDATVIAKLKQAGAVILGKTNLDEFAHGASTENSAFGPTHNPWDLTRVPGGSSGGSAAAVAADQSIAALGTDTGGSIRYPAGFCGVVGLKPTYGRCSRYGLLSMTSSTDVPGPITKTVTDAAIMLQAMAGPDANDA